MLFHLATAMLFHLLFQLLFHLLHSTYFACCIAFISPVVNLNVDYVLAHVLKN